MANLSVVAYVLVVPLVLAFGLTVYILAYIFDRATAREIMRIGNEVPDYYDDQTTDKVKGEPYGSLSK